MPEIEDLPQSNGVGIGHDNDLAARDLAPRVGGVQQADQVMRGHHGWRFVSVDRGLEIALGTAARVPVAKDRDGFAGSGCCGEQRVLFDLLGGVHELMCLYGLSLRETYLWTGCVSGQAITPSRLEPHRL